jgi:hypothetical protein
LPTVKRHAALVAAYSATKKKIDDVPTVLLNPGQTLFRSFNPNSAHSSLPKPQPGTHVSKLQANKLLIPGDENSTTVSAAPRTMQPFLPRLGFIAYFSSRRS